MIPVAANFMPAKALEYDSILSGFMGRICAALYHSLLFEKVPTRLYGRHDACVGAFARTMASSRVRVPLRHPHPDMLLQLSVITAPDELCRIRGGTHQLTALSILVNWEQPSQTMSYSSVS